MTETGREKATPKEQPFIGRQADKLLDHLWGWAIPTGCVALLAILAKERAILLGIFWTSQAPVILPIALAIPAFVTIFRVFRYLLFRPPEPLYFTVDPLQSSANELWSGPDQPHRLQLTLSVTVANPSKTDALLMYAYLKGSQPISHFFEPLSIGPEEVVISELLSCQCTLPKGKLSDPSKVTIVFVEAIGIKFRQKASIRYFPIPANYKPPAISKQASQSGDITSLTSAEIGPGQEK